VLVPIEQATDGTGTPLDPSASRDLADPAQRGGRRPGASAGHGRRRPTSSGRALLVAAIAERTIEVYRAALSAG
jgi:starch synthase